MMGILETRLEPLQELYEFLHGLADGISCGGQGKACPVGSRLTGICRKAREAWAFAVISGEGEAALRGYFNYQVQMVADSYKVLSRLPGEYDSSVQTLNELSDHLHHYFSRYTDRSLPCPEAYCLHKLALLHRQYLACREMVESVNGIGDELRCCLLAYLGRYFDGQPCWLTFGTLDYLELFLREVTWALRREAGGEPEEPLIRKLFGINFNDLHFLSCLQEQVQRKLSGLTLTDRYEFLQEQSCRIPQGGGCKGLGYDPAWPAVTIMFGNWLSEMAACAEQQIRLTESRPLKPAEKIGLNLTVPQIACFIRLFFEEGLYLTSSLKEIFRITAQGRSSKRQTAISPGSLSQQYYSSDPMAAATVRELLVKMIARINKHYFQVMAAVSAAYLWL